MITRVAIVAEDRNGWTLAKAWARRRVLEAHEWLSALHDSDVEHGTDALGHHFEWLRFNDVREWWTATDAKLDRPVNAPMRKAPNAALRALLYFDSLDAGRVPDVVIFARDLDRTEDRVEQYELDDPPIVCVRALAQTESEAWVIASLERTEHVATIATLGLACLVRADRPPPRGWHHALPRRARRPPGLTLRPVIAAAGRRRPPRASRRPRSRASRPRRSAPTGPADRG